MAATEMRGESVYSLDRFFRASREKTVSGETFESESERMLRVELDGGVWLKPGAAIAYRGDIAFKRLPTATAETLGEAAMRELAPLVRAEGRGRLYCGHHGSHVRIIRLAGSALVVAWQELLAFEDTLEFESSMVGQGIGLAAGGLATVRLNGHGALALATHGEPLTLPVTPDNPVYTDPHATLAWTPELSPTLKMDLQWRSVFWHGGHEPFQMRFEGQGAVIVQPYEDPRRFSLKLDPLSQLKTLLTP